MTNNFSQSQYKTGNLDLFSVFKPSQANKMLVVTLVVTAQTSSYLTHPENILALKYCFMFFHHYLPMLTIADCAVAQSQTRLLNSGIRLLVSLL